MSFDDSSSGSGRRRGLERGQGQPPPQFRNIPLTPEIVAMGFTDIQVQAQNMVLRHQDGLMILSKYDAKDLVKTQRLIESKLAEYIGKPKGLPSTFLLPSFLSHCSTTFKINMHNIRKSLKKRKGLYNPF